jgi:hypothetical protein
MTGKQPRRPAGVSLDLAHPRNNDMTPHSSDELSTRSTDWSPFVIMGNKMPPRDPDDEEDEDEDEEDEDEDEDEDEEDADEPPVVREPDED